MKMPLEDRVLAQCEIANKLAQWLNEQPLRNDIGAALTEGSPVYDAWVMLTHLITKSEAMERALASLVSGVEDLEQEWPTLDLPSEGRHNELIGFLFATLPIAQKALR